MTTRVVTQYYDKALHASGLKATQFSLLINIASREAGISVNELAELSMMDQTTVTRNVEILRKAGYVIVRIEDTDSRRKSIAVSEIGKNRLEVAMPLWEEAQLKILQAVGRDEYKNFLEVLTVMQKVK
jgi:DNA-binding MarR family transcriptional regulator